MKLLKATDPNKHGEAGMEEVSSSDDVEELKHLGRKLCQENGFLDTVWITSTKAWQELSTIDTDGKPLIHFVIRP